jgi:hypothetical protein
MKRFILTLSLLALCAPARAQAPVTVVIDGRSYSLTLTPLDGGVGPIAPDSLNAEKDALGRLVVTWADKSTDETGFILWRKTGGEWARIATTAANVTAFTDWGVTPGDHAYRVQATKETGSSGFTPEVTVTFAVGTQPVPLGPIIYDYTTPDGAPLVAIAPGDTIAIRGESFGESGHVYVNATSVIPRLWTDSTILVTLPEGPFYHPPTIGVVRKDGRHHSGMMSWSLVKMRAAEVAR